MASRSKDAYVRRRQMSIYILRRLGRAYQFLHKHRLWCTIAQCMFIRDAVPTGGPFRPPNPSASPSRPKKDLE